MSSKPAVCGSDTLLGMGCWAIGAHGWGPVDDDESIQAIRYAFDNGLRLFDTADCYGLGHSEKTLACALGDNRHLVSISTKCGVRWNNAGQIWKDNSPGYLRTALVASLERLQLESVPLFFVHWPDGVTPIDEVIGEIERMKQEGLIQSAGLSNFSVKDLRVALASGVIDVIQVKLNLMSRQDFVSMQQLCIQYGVRTMTYGCLAEGLLTGKFSPETQFPSDDHRSTSSEFQGDRFIENLRFVEELKKVALALGVPVANVALRAVLDQKGVDCVLFGARNIAQVKQNLACRQIQLQESMGEIDHLIQRFGLSKLSWKI